MFCIQIAADSSFRSNISFVRESFVFEAIHFVFCDELCRVQTKVKKKCGAQLPVCLILEFLQNLFSTRNKIYGLESFVSEAIHFFIRDETGVCVTDHDFNIFSFLNLYGMCSAPQMMFEILENKTKCFPHYNC